MLEWNTWRAMTMLNGGEIKVHLIFDDEGQPMDTAPGKTADITCDFGLTVEVTMQGGARQYEAEGEPVARHLANYQREIEKDSYSLFIAPKLNEASIAYFYSMHNIDLVYYGGKSVIVPIELSTFIKMLEDSYNADYKPSPDHAEELFEYSKQVATEASNEVEWFEKITEKALTWLD